MNTKEIAATEIESLVLYLNRDWCSYCRKGKYGATEWACANRLSSLFEIDDDADEICFVAKSRADRSTYKVVLDEEVEMLIKPVSAVLYAPLVRWLKKQIAAGRPHIGVRIVK